MNRWGLSICAWLLLACWTVANHYPPWRVAHADLLAAAAAAALAAAGLGRAAPPTRVDGPVLFLLAIALVPPAQAATGQIYFAGDGWIAALYVGCAAWTVLWSAHATRIDRDRWVATLAAALAAGALLSSLIATVQWWKVDTGPLSLFIALVPRAHATVANIGQPNQLNTLLALGIAALTLMYERRWVAGPLALSAAILLTCTMAITQSRTGILLFGCALVWHAVYSRRIGLRTPRSVGFALAAFWCAAFAAWPRLLDAFGLSAGTSFLDRWQGGTRAVIWSQLWDAVWLHPWVGFGWNQVSVAQMAVAADFAGSQLTEHSHNLVLDLLLWNGVPLALLIGSVATWWLVRSAARVHSVDGAFAVLVLALFLAHAMVEFPLDYLYFLVPFGMALGILTADVGGARSVLVVSRPLGALGLLAFVGIAGWAANDYWRVEEAYRTMRFTAGRIGSVPRAEGVPPLKTQFTQLSAFYQYSMTAPRPHVEASELAWMRKVAHRFGFAPTLYRYALAQALNGDLPGARLTLLQLRRLHGERHYADAKEELRQMAAEYPLLGHLQLP